MYIMVMVYEPISHCAADGDVRLSNLIYFVPNTNTNR